MMEGRDELMRLSAREREEREGRRQRKAGKGPARLREGRETELTEE